MVAQSINMKSMLRTTFLFALLCLSPLVRADGAAPALPGTAVAITPLPKEYSEDKVVVAVSQAAISRGWTVVSTDHGVVVITLNHRGIDSKLFLVIGKGSVQIYSDSWTVNGSGTHQKPTVPTRWINNLQQDILHFVGLLGSSPTGPGAGRRRADPSSMPSSKMTAIPSLRPGFGLGDSELTVPVDCLAGPKYDTVFAARPGSVSVVAGDAHRPREEATGRLYHDLLEQSRGSFLYRIWNYVPAINGVTAGLEHYRHFCRGRSLAFEEHYGRDFQDRMPAASAVGCGGRALIVAYLAGKDAPEYLENPRQIPAYQYPPDYGPRAPSFARATAVRAAGQGDFFIAGTSAIVGHATVAPSRTGAQVDCTLENLRAISRVCGLGNDLGAGRGGARHFKVYLRHASDLPEVTARLDERLLGQGDQVSYLHADICRADLNVEIEATLLGTSLA